MQDVLAPPIIWHSAGPELCGPNGNDHCCATGWCLQLVYHACYWSRYADLEAFDSTHLVITQFVVQKQGSLNVPAPVQMDSPPGV
jgi:hypothetical protein